MALLPDQTITIVLELQKRLLLIIHQTTAMELLMMERYGETEATIIDLEQEYSRTSRHILCQVLQIITTNCRISTLAKCCYHRIAR